MRILLSIFDQNMPDLQQDSLQKDKAMQHVISKRFQDTVSY